VHRCRPMALTGILVALSLAVAACDGGTAQSAPAEPTDPATAEPTEPATAEPTQSAPASEATGSTASVMLMDFQFDTTTLTVSAGTTVTFMNHDPADHTVTEGIDGALADGAFVDELVEAGASVDVAFDEAGTFNITCRIHPDMNVTVIVEG
jgi:plastocyanin